MADVHRSALSYACELHNALQAELSAAEQHPRSAYNLKLYVEATRNRLQNIQQHVARCINIALEELRPTGQDARSHPWHVPEMAKLRCPWTPRSCSTSQLG